MWTRMTRMHHNPPSSAPSPARRARCDRRGRQRTDARRRRIQRIQRARDQIVQTSTRRSPFARRVVRARREFASEGSRSTRRVSFRCRPLTLDPTRFVVAPSPERRADVFFSRRGGGARRGSLSPPHLRPARRRVSRRGGGVGMVAAVASSVRRPRTTTATTRAADAADPSVIAALCSCAVTVPQEVRW